MITYQFADNQKSYAAAAALFEEYAAWLQVDLCFQGFTEELKTLPQVYKPTEGGIILACDGGNFIASIALKQIADGVCEVKRLYVQPAYRKQGIAEQLVKRIIDLARSKHYNTIKLDTLRHMQPAINLYKKFGFAEAGAYYYNPHATAIYMELNLLH